MRHAVALLFAATVAVAAPVPKALKAKRPDAECILGTWETVSPEVDPQATGTATWAFEGGGDLKMFSWAGKPTGRGSEYAIRLHPEESPKRIDIGSLKGIYALDGDDLRVAYNMNTIDRPTDFTPQPGVHYKRMRRVEGK
jgi:uncharacterized protein (TIGR03067 family)